MRTAKSIFCAFVASASLAACGAPTLEETNNSLKAATALAVPDLTPEQIEIVSKDQQKSKWIWQAKVGSKTYDCDADDRMRLPSCQAAG